MSASLFLEVVRIELGNFERTKGDPNFVLHHEPGKALSVDQDYALDRPTEFDGLLRERRCRDEYTLRCALTGQRSVEAGREAATFETIVRPPSPILADGLHATR